MKVSDFMLMNKAKDEKSLRRMFCNFADDILSDSEFTNVDAIFLLNDVPVHYIQTKNCPKFALDFSPSKQMYPLSKCFAYHVLHRDEFKQYTSEDLLKRHNTLRFNLNLPALDYVSIVLF